MFKRKHKKNLAFTLIEVLVASGVSLLLGVTIFNVFVHSKRALAHAIGTADLVRATRIPMDRIGTYLGAGAGTASQDTILFPPNGFGLTNRRGQTVMQDDATTWYRYVVIRTTEDFLNPAYDPDEIFDLETTRGTPGHVELMAAYENDAHRIYDYLIWFEDENVAGGINTPLIQEDKVLAVGRILPNTSPPPAGGTIPITNFRTIGWAQGSPWLDLDPAVPPRIIARGLDDVTFLRETSGLDVNVQATAIVQTAANGPQPKTYHASQRIHLVSDLMR